MRRIYRVIDWLLGTAFAPPAPELAEPSWSAVDLAELALATRGRRR